MKPIEYQQNISDFFVPDFSVVPKSSIKIYNREDNFCHKKLNANRREFYQIIFFNKGKGLLHIGLNAYEIVKPTMVFIHPNEIISWENSGKETTGHICLFNKAFLNHHLSLKTVMGKYPLFIDTSRSVVEPDVAAVTSINEIFLKMHLEQEGGQYSEDSLQAYIQLLIIKSAVSDLYPKTQLVNNEYVHVRNFFHLLEQQAVAIDCRNPLLLKTAYEYAQNLAVHPNYLNALLKKYTNQTLSNHIKDRLLEQSKILLIQTDWTLQNIGNAIGFTAQPTFSHFFKKKVGITPTEYRKKNTVYKG